MKNISWNWRYATVSLIAMIPAVCIMIFGNTTLGLTVAIGVVIACILPLPPTRKNRLARIPLIGCLIAIGLVLGSLLSNVPVLAVASIGALAYGLARLATTGYGKLGAAGTALLPIVAIGFSYQDTAEALGLGLVIIAGAVWTALLSLALPESSPRTEEKEAASGDSKVGAYSVTYALAAMVSSAIPFAAGWQHVGWVAGSTLFVMRPTLEMTDFRSLWRAVSVFVGAAAAAILLSLDMSAWVAAVVVTLVVAVASATRGSRWYITPGFLTFIVFFVLLYGKTGDGAIAGRFEERVGEVLLGIAIACIAIYVANFVAKRR